LGTQASEMGRPAEAVMMAAELNAGEHRETGVVH
jgi:hypothetical protein